MTVSPASYPGPDAATARSALSCSRRGCPCERGPNVHCPTGRHTRNDDTPSLTIHDGTDGYYVFHCKAGCPEVEIIRALETLGVWHGRGKRNGARPNGTTHAPRTFSKRAATPDDLYEYVELATGRIALKGRFDLPECDEATGKRKKTFAWQWADSEVPWNGGPKMAALALFGAETLMDLAPGSEVVFTEGERAALATRERGLIAVSGAGGGVPSAEALEMLRGHRVYAWGDNDAAGREYMAKVKAMLTGVAARVTLLTPPVPEKGDAVEYFAAGGTVEDLFASAPPERAVVQPLSFDAVRVRVPVDAGVLAFQFTEMEKTTRDLNCELEIWREGSKDEPYSLRINLLSITAREALRRELTGIHGGRETAKLYGWESAINTAISMARKWFEGQARAVQAADLPLPSGEDALSVVDALIPMNGPTVIYGDGSASKSYTCIAIAIAVAAGEPFCGMAVRQGGVLYIDYEDSEEGWHLRLWRLYQGMGCTEEPRLPIYRWEPRGLAIVDQIGALRRYVAEMGISLIIIDSAMPACGGPPEESHLATAYFNALSKLPASVTTVTIAHITKANLDEKIVRTPFGSIVWRNRPRCTWFVVREQDEDADVIDVGWFHTKANDGRLMRPVAFNLSFVERVGPVTIKQAKLRDMDGISQRRTNRARLIEALRDGPNTVVALAEVIGASVEVTGAELRRGHHKSLFVQLPSSITPGGSGRPVMWALRAKEDETRTD